MALPALPLWLAPFWRLEGAAVLAAAGAVGLAAGVSTLASRRRRETRRRVQAHLQRVGGSSAREVALDLGAEPAGVEGALVALARTGLVTRRFEENGRSGRMRWVYYPAPLPSSASPRGAEGAGPPEVAPRRG